MTKKDYENAIYVLREHYNITKMACEETMDRALGFNDEIEARFPESSNNDEFTKMAESLKTFEKQIAKAAYEFFINTEATFAKLEKEQKV